MCGCRKNLPAAPLTAEEEAAKAERLRALREEQERVRIERNEARRRIREERLYSRRRRSA